MRQHLSLPNVVTSVSLTTGFLALLVAPVKVALATALVLLAAVLDGVDGALARRAGGDRTFGAQLDSLADLLCFCVVPAFTVHETVLKDMPVPGLLASCGILLAGAWRLARFPLVQQQGHFVGLPTPAAGSLIMLLALGAPAVPALLGVALLSALMVSSLRFPTVRAAAAAVRPGRGAHTPRPWPRREHPRLVPRVLARTRRPRSRGPGRAGRQRAVERAGRALRVLRKGGMRQ